MKLKIFVVLSFCMFFLNSNLFGGDKPKEFKIPYEKYKLSNGMNVLLHTDKSDPIVSVYVVYHVGSARELPGKTGFAHLFEHLRFNESQNVPQGQWFKKLQTAGASMINGSTNNDRTNYFEVVPKNALEMTLWMESDRMGFLLSKVNQQTFITQQGVVQNEKRQGENRAYAQTSYIMDKLMYPENHPYNWQVIGSLEDLANATLQDVIDFHNKFYVPGNATLVVAGDIDVAQTKAWIDKYFSEIKAGPIAEDLPKTPVVLAENKRAYYEDNLANAPELNIAYSSAEDFAKDSYALEFLGRLLSSKKFPLYKVIVEEKHLAPSVMARQNGGELAGSFGITVRAFPDTLLGSVESAINEALARFEKEGFTDKDVERQKAGIEMSFYNSISSILGKSMRLADYNIFNGSPDYMTTDFNNRLSVTKEDIWRVYNKYVKGQKYILASFVPKGKANLAAPDSKLFVVPEESIEKQGAKKEVAAVKTELIPSQIDRTKEPVKGKDPVLNPPKIWKDKTANGIEVFGIKQSELPTVQFSIVLKGGMLLDSKDKVGVANLTAKLMNEGTKNKTPIELREAIQELGASLSFSCGSEVITLSGSCLVSKLNETIALAKEMLYEPRWDEKEFGIAKSQVVEELKRSSTNLNSIASNVFSKIIYGEDNILSNEPIGNLASVKLITIDELKNYYQKYFSSSAAKIMVVGDVDNKTAVNAFSALKDWKSAKINYPKLKAKSSAKPGVYFVDVPKSKQSVFNVGHTGPSVTDPEYYKSVVMNYKLGGDFSSILNMILREKKSFTYGARSGFAANAFSGIFTASTSVQANATYETAQIIRDEIQKYRDGISQEDLDLVKSTLLKSNAGKFETPMQLSQMLSPVVLYSLPFDYIKKREAVVINMSTAEEKAIAQKYIHPDKMVYLIVGDKATQFDKLKELGLGDPVLLDKEGKPVKQ